MADWKEFIFSDTFKAYRQKQLIAIVGHIAGLLKSGMYEDIQPAELKGALSMAAKLLRLPSELINDTELEGELNKLIQEDLIGLTTYLVREQLK